MCYFAENVSLAEPTYVVVVVVVYRMAQKKRGHPISLQIFWKFHNRIALKLQYYAEHSQ